LFIEEIPGFEVSSGVSLIRANKKLEQKRGSWPAQSEEHATLDLGGCEFEPHIQCRDYFKKKKKEQVHGAWFYLHRKGAEEDVRVKEGARSIIFIDDTYKEKEVSAARMALKMCSPDQQQRHHHLGAC